MAGVTFEGYPDPLVDLVNSKFVQTLINVTAPNAPIPHIPAMGYFPFVSDLFFILKGGEGRWETSGEGKITRN